MIRYLKIMATVLALVFVSGCAVHVRDDDWRYRRRYRHPGWHWHGSSLQQLPQTQTGELVAHSFERPSGQNDLSK